MTEMHHKLESSTCDALKYKMGNSIVILSTMGKSMSVKRFKDKVNIFKDMCVF